MAIDANSSRKGKGRWRIWGSHCAQPKASPFRATNTGGSRAYRGNYAGMFVRTFVLFVVTALAEIVGCYLPYLWLRQGRSIWLLVPTALSLAVFSWLLTLHPTAAGRTYAAYGGVYISVAIVWLWVVEKQTPTARDMLGVGLCLIGMAVIATGPSSSVALPVTTTP